MPRTEEQNRQMLLQLGYELATGMRTGKYGPQGQKFVDFLNAAAADGAHAIEGEKKQAAESNQYRPRRPELWVRSRGNRLNRMTAYKSSLYAHLIDLGNLLQAGKYESAKEKLSTAANDLSRFSFDYDQLKDTIPELFVDQPVYEAFDRFWTGETKFPLGEQLLERLEGVNRDKALELPDQDREFVFRAQAYKNEDIPSLNINEEVIRTQRKNRQLNKVRKYQNRYDPRAKTYEGVLGACMEGLERDSGSAETQFARALAAASLRKQGVPYEEDAVDAEAERIKNSPAFPVMTENRYFVMDSLEKPEKIDRVLSCYERESKALQRVRTGPKSYSEYLRLHTWPHVPEGKEKEYLAKCVSALRLQRNKTPFDLATIRKDAEELQKQYSFRELTTKNVGREAGPARVRRWLHQEEIDVADITIRHHRGSKINQSQDSKTQKTWAGYRRMHMKENVPANATPADQRLYLAKAMIAIRGMAEDKAFNLKAARKAAAALTKNSYFRAATRNPQAVRQALAEGKVAQFFDKMAEARSNELRARQKPEERILNDELSLGESGRETPETPETLDGANRLSIRPD